jgi:ABC-type nitrate/sulfonate/bicarbonate transport system permease component
VTLLAARPATETTRPRPAGGRSGRALPVLPPAAALVALLAVWQVGVTVSGVRPQVLPSPWRVANAGWAARDALWTNTVPTLQVTVVGFAMSLAISWALAVVVHFSPWLRRAVLPLLVASQTVPIIAIAPLLIIWFGFGLTPKVLVIVLVTFLPVTIGLVEGFAATEPEVVAAARLDGASAWLVLWRIRVPLALPAFFTALRIGITYAVAGAVFAEYVGATAGLGIYMQLQKNSFRTDLVLAAVAVAAAVSVTLFVLTYIVEWIAVPWNRAERRGPS